NGFADGPWSSRQQYPREAARRGTETPGWPLVANLSVEILLAGKGRARGRRPASDHRERRQPGVEEPPPTPPEEPVYGAGHRFGAPRPGRKEVSHGGTRLDRQPGSQSHRGTPRPEPVGCDLLEADRTQVATDTGQSAGKRRQPFTVVGPAGSQRRPC